MDPLDFLKAEELLQFFRRRKKEMSCMENPHTFLRQLRDYDLLPEDSYKKVSRMKSKENLKKNLYDILDWLERERPNHIHRFWSCVFKEPIINQYPALKLMRNSLLDGSYYFDAPESEDMEEMDEKKRKQLSEDEEEEEEQKSSVKKKRKQIRKSVCNDEEEQPGPSSQLTPGQRKQNKKISFSSLSKKGEKSEVWTWAIFKSQLPVTCGDQEGSLNRDRLAKGKKCILSEKQWFTPSEFEKFAGKRSKNWKINIQCNNTPLGKLIEEGHLKSAKYTGGHKKAKKSLFPSDHLIAASCEEENDEEEGDQEDQDSSSNKDSSSNITDEEEEAEEQAEQQSEDHQDRSKIVFKVTCGAAAGTLHKKRFGSGTCGKSICTETKWMTPVEFVNEASSQSNACWKKDIKWEGKPLSVLIEEKILVIHPLLCPCRLCKPDAEDLENQKNDDQCYICCKRVEEAELVVCDDCPRSFHQKCHLPHVDDADLRDGRPWMCIFCALRTTQELHYNNQPDMTTVLSYQISQHMLECQYLFLYLRSADEEQTFALNPTLYLERYSTIVQTPMWLGKVAEKLQENEYGTVGEFVSDVQLIFTNWATYHHDNAVFLSLGDRLKELFDGEFKKVFNICEPTVG